MVNDSEPGRAMTAYTACNEVIEREKAVLAARRISLRDSALHKDSQFES